jgi:ABC-type Na+ efflux pump permease subunit
MATDKRVLSDTEVSKVQGALAVLLGIVGSAEFSTDEVEANRKALPSSLDNTDNVKAILGRTLAALETKLTEADRAVKVAFKSGVEAECEKARQAAIEGYRVIHALPASVKAMLGDKAKPPTAAKVLVSEIVKYAPDGMTWDNLHKLIVATNFKLTPGRKEDSQRSIYVPISEKTVTEALATEE